MRITVGVSEMAVSADPGETLITYSLGSCVGLSLWDSAAGVGGLIHSLLPLSRIDAAKAAANPCMFVDTGVPTLLQALFERGAQRRTLVAKVAGGSRIMGGKDVFNIGQRNCVVLRKLLWKNGILVSGEDTGGSMPRTMRLCMQTGRTLLASRGMEREI